MSSNKITKALKQKIPKNMTVIYGGISEEKNICIMEGERIIKLLSQKGHKIYPIKIDGSNKFIKLLEKAPKCAILCLTEDLGIQWILDLYKIKYNGSGPLATMLSMDKVLVKIILEKSDILTPKFQILNSSEVTGQIKGDLDYPLIVKPNRGGSSHGLSLVKSKINLEKSLEKAFKDDSQILIEEFIEGVEITIVCLGKKTLGIVELNKNGKPVYDYLTKFKGHISYVEPARIPTKATEYIHTTIPKLVDLLSLRNLFRVDAIVHGTKVYILEINTLPFLADGGEPFEAVRNEGIDIYEFLGDVIYDFTIYKKSRPLE